MVLGHILVHRAAADFFCSTLPVHIDRSIPYRPSRFSRPAFFCPIFLGTASGQFLRPAASRPLLSRFRPYTTIGFPPIKQPLALEAAALAFGCPEKWGRKRRHFHVLL